MKPGTSWVILAGVALAFKGNRSVAQKRQGGQPRGTRLMKIALHMTTEPEECPYLPAESNSMEFVLVEEMSLEEYEEKLVRGWRRFGRQVFRPVCQDCQECVSLRIDPKSFRPNRSQKRNRSSNQRRIELTIGKPEITPEIMTLHDKYHQERSRERGWTQKENEDYESFHQTFLENPFPVEQWSFREKGDLRGVGYVDALKCGLSAIYFFYDPAFASLGLGTWNVLKILEETARRKLPHAYLGYYVGDCQSLAYKAFFRPCQVLKSGAEWVWLE